MIVNDGSMPCPACRVAVAENCPACGGTGRLTPAFLITLAEGGVKPAIEELLLDGALRELAAMDRDWDDRETYSNATLYDPDSGLWYGMSVHLINGQWCDSGKTPHESRDASKAAELALTRAIAERGRR